MLRPGSGSALPEASRSDRFAQALLLTIADMSVVLAKVQVDETDVVRLALGDSVRVTIDAFPDSTFTGRVSLVANSATLTATQTAGGSSGDGVHWLWRSTPPRSRAYRSTPASKTSASRAASGSKGNRKLPRL